MGLESVELVLDVERAFGIDMPDEVAQEIVTVGQLNDAVLRLIRADGKSEFISRPDLEPIVWQRICTLSAKLAREMKPSDIRHSTRFLEDLGYGG